MQPSGQTDRLAPGTVLGGKYRIERVLGRGGMGVVVLAHHEELDQRVAIKVLTGEIADNPEAVARFLREARSSAKLQSDHVARVTDVGRFEAIGPYMVMEYLNGVDLSQLLEAHGSRPVAEAVDYVLQALDAVAEAHSIGIVHRDLKPSNLFLADRADGTKIIKVLDFGISKVDPMHEPATCWQKLTSTRAVIGSPAYMSPEQLKSARDVDARADIWSIGVVLYELLTGALPFDGETVGALFARIIAEDPHPLRARVADVPELLEQAVMRCLRRDAPSRWETVGDLATALAPFGSGRASKEVQRAVALGKMRVAMRPSSPSIPEIPALSPASPIHAQTQNTWQTPHGLAAPKLLGMDRHLAIAVGGGALAAMLIAVGMLVITHRSPDEHKSIAAPTVPTSTASVLTIPSLPAASTALPAPTPASSQPTKSISSPASAARPVKSAAPAVSASAVPSTSSTSFLDRQR
jgi:serine/threonine-protein kinase